MELPNQQKFELSTHYASEIISLQNKLDKSYQELEKYKDIIRQQEIMEDKQDSSPSNNQYKTQLEQMKKNSKNQKIAHEAE